MTFFRFGKDAQCNGNNDKRDNKERENIDTRYNTELFQHSAFG
jgi:hypothetical protein